MRARLALLLAPAAVALVAAAGANAWSQRYAYNTVFYTGNWAASAWNGSLNPNYINWDRRYGGYPSVGLRYCRTDGSCYAYVWTQTPGPFYDTRSISYGRGECKAYGGNNYPVYVTECRVSNG
jgi:hypothetical protein